MFSGIIEEFATVVAIEKDRENIDFTLKCSFVDELKIDQSVAHNGVCLTVVRIVNGTYTVTAMKETLDRTNLGLLKVGDKVNVERSMLMNGRLDGHIVQGHVDETAKCIAMEDADGSTYFTFEYPENREMCQSDGLQSHEQHLPGSHHPLHLRAHQLLRHPRRQCREPGVRYPWKIYCQITAVVIRAAITVLMERR